MASHTNLHTSLMIGEDDLSTREADMSSSPADNSETLYTVDTNTQIIDLSTDVRVLGNNPIAHGGFADVYRGEWERTIHSINVNEHEKTIQVVVKVLRAFGNLDRDADLARARKRLNREVYIWKRLNHPNVAKFYGVSFQLGGRSGLVMRWYKNGAAPKYIKDRPMVSKLALVEGVGEGLQYLHTLTPPIVHGDLKGNNVLVDDDGRPVLADFGLSRAIEEVLAPTGNTTTTVAGSFRWQAPELHVGEEEGQLSSTTPPTLPSDVWSYGCTAYELFTGKVPYFNHKLNWKVSLEIMRGVSPLRHEEVIDWPEEIVKILRDCWALSPTERPDMATLTSGLSEVSLD